MVVKGFKWIKSLGKAAKKCDSFPPGTDVTLADGTSKPIEDINVGDKVLATDPETGETVARPVLATIITEDDKHFVDLTIATDDDDRPASIIATTHHPIWDQGKQTWVDAGNLKPGTTLRTPDGTNAHVTAIHHFDKRQRTHNLTVEGLHTYHVLAGSTPVLIHNSNCFGDKWSDGNNLDEHFRKHGEEMGFDTMTEYNYAAQDLMCMCDGRRSGVLMKRDGDVQRFFDPESGEFGSAGPRGIITYFKPDDGLDYFRRQAGVEVP